MVNLLLYTCAFCAVIVVVLSGTAVNIPGVKTTEKYDNAVILDKDQSYILFWKFNDSHITFEVHVKTKGWVGFGLSGNGNMFPADVVVGWVENNGTVHFADRHTEGRFMPIKDSSQDWHLLFGEENDFGTVLKFIRKINTCDGQDDLVIPEGTARIIFAHNKNDPPSDDGIPYHGTSRGTKSVSLLSSYKVPDSMPEKLIHYDFLNTNHMIPNISTSYNCRGFYMPDIGKHHMIKPFFFPDNVGFSISGPGDPSFYIIETHYDNPTLKTGFIDNSGIRITLTKDMRPMEAGLFEFGHMVNAFQIIPPSIEDFVSTGYCSERCIREGFEQSQLNDVKVFAAFQHSHLLGVGMKTRHFRNGTELRPIVNDPDYDFDFQENRLLPQEVTVFPGDSFSVECTYDSRGRTGPTFGGLSTEDEMCLTFVYYYPAMKMVNCLSQPLYDSFNLTRHELYHAIHTSDWTNKSFVAEVKNNLKKSTVSHHCFGADFKSPATEYFVEDDVHTPYTPPSDNCAGQ